MAVNATNHAKADSKLVRIIIIIIIGLSLVFPRFHGLDSSQKYHSTKPRDRAHPPASNSTASCHLPYTPSMFFNSYLYLFP
jgi:hypothetical protein